MLYRFRRPSNYHRNRLRRELLRRTLAWSIPITCIAALLVANAATTVTGPSQQAATQPAFSDLSGSAACAQLPALTGDTTTSAGACATTTAKVNGVSYGTSPSTNTVPVVTGSNTITYETVPNAALTNASTTVNSTTCTLGSTCTITAAQGSLNTVTKTANYTVLSGDNGTCFDNTGASGTVIFTLPTEADGLNYCFTVVAAQTVEILAPSTVKIAIGPTNSAAAGNVQSNGNYASVWLYAPKGATTQWVARSLTGTWTVN